MCVCVHVSVCVLNIPGPKTYFPRRNKKVKLICIYMYTYIYIFMYTHTHTHITYMLAVLGPHCCTQTLVVASRGYTLDMILGLLTVVTSFVAEHRF